MSFLRKEATSSSAMKLSSGDSKALPSAYSNSECKVVLEPVVKPVGTKLYERKEHKNQIEVINQLKREAPELFQHKLVISKETDGERLYKQKQQFSSKISIESLADVLSENNLCLRASFARPGFNSQNSSFMITAEHLQQMLQLEENEHGLKQQKFFVGNNEETAGQSGYVIFSLQPEKTDHVAYSVDYHALVSVDDKLFSEH
tara:strand:+ start:8346 stop:8954 length:609 start_codon:yes stop_codon:yes gene_type:complete